MGPLHFPICNVIVYIARRHRQSLPSQTDCSICLRSHCLGRVMVNRGASRGCVTCKKRRVKCDETQPACKECIRVGRECAGYGRQAVRVRFRDESARYLHKPPDRPASAKTAGHEVSQKTTRKGSCAHCPLRGPRSRVSIPARLPLKQQDVAVAFFLTYVTDVGRDLESTRGFLEFVRPVLAAESHESALSAAVNSTAVKLWTLLRPSSGAVAEPLPIQLHNQALVRLQQAVYHPVEQGSDATVLAALLLQQHDTLAAVFDHHQAHSTHRDGAWALLTQKGRDRRISKYRGHLLGNLFHSKVSSCVRHKVPLTGNELDWLETEIVPALPSNPSYLLDVVGISISKLQRALAESSSPHEDVAMGALQELPDMIRNVESQLKTWLDAVPDFWRPRRIQAEHALPSSVTTYDGSCDIYPSVQIANIWNTWRISCLIVAHAKMKLTFADEQDFAMPTDSAGAQLLQGVLNLVESICRSIPFYLGNYSRPISFSDIDNPELVFPSYYDLPPHDEARVSYKNSDYCVSKVDYYRHLVLHGPLCALSVLSSLISLLFEEQWPIPVQDAMNRQKQWIDEQFHRSLYLTRFLPRAVKPTVSSDHLHRASRPTALAQATRQALWTVTTL